MCLAIAPNNRSNNGIIARLWRLVSSSPFRLLGVCALTHSLILGGLLLHDITTAGNINVAAYLFGLNYGIFSLLCFGYLLTSLPQKYSLSPVHYGRYNTIYLFMMTGLGVLEGGIFFDSQWIFTGMLLLVPAWLIALQSVKHLHTWMNSAVHRLGKALRLLLFFNFITLGLSILGQFYSASMLVILAMSSSILLVWPPLIGVSLALVYSAPAKGRVVSL
jgi:hypothetical protein